MKIAALLLAGLLAVNLASAQTPTPVVIHAVATPQTAPATQPGDSTAAAALQAVQALKAANDELLKKQTATMQKLDELQKTAEQLKIYSKRG
jgi:hypothetical protein